MEYVILYLLACSPLTASPLSALISGCCCSAISSGANSSGFAFIAFILFASWDLSSSLLPVVQRITLPKVVKFDQHAPNITFEIELHGRSKQHMKMEGLTSKKTRVLQRPQLMICFDLVHILNFLSTNPLKANFQVLLGNFEHPPVLQ